MSTSTTSTDITIPSPLRNWLKSQYPTLTPKEPWLKSLISSYKGPRSAADGRLIEFVHEALLNSDLKDVAACSVLNVRKEGVLGGGPRGAVLVQVVGKLDIGVSCQAQLDVLEARRLARTTIAGTALLQAGIDSSSSAHALQDPRHSDDNDDDGEKDQTGDHMNDFNAAEEAAALPATVFPRSMLQLELSDGYTTVIGFEHRRIPDLSMADTPLGAKLILKDITIKNGRLFLEPRGVMVKGGQVEILEKDAEEKLIDRLRQKLGKPPLERKDRVGMARGQATANSADTDVPAAAGPPMAAAPQGPPSSFDEAQFEEDEAVWAELQEEAIGRAVQAPIPRHGEGQSNEARRSATAASRGSTLPQQRAPTPSPPPHLPLRKKLKATENTRYHRPRLEEDDLRGDEELGASFFAGMSEDEKDFLILEKNDEGNPIVLSDSD